jgi:hypothetical protein
MCYNGDKITVYIIVVLLERFSDEKKNMTFRMCSASYLYAHWQPFFRFD